MEDKPVGQLFTHTYLERGEPTKDNKHFRVRLGGYVQSDLHDVHGFLANHLKKEAGLKVIAHSTGMGAYYHFEDFFLSLEIVRLLDVITLTWRLLRLIDLDRLRKRSTRRSEMAESWQKFVGRVFAEENLGYFLDEECGVHHLVDEEFEHNRAATLRCLGSPRYEGVRAAFETAYAYFDRESPDTIAASRSMFESIEILGRLMEAGKNLNSYFVKNKLLPLAKSALASDKTAEQTLEKIFDGIASWVDGVHNYRHGQGEEKPVLLPTGMATYILSTGAAFLRLLVEVDQTLKSDVVP